MITGGDFSEAMSIQRFALLASIYVRIGLKSYLRLSTLVARLSSITSPDVPTYFRPD